MTSILRNAGRRSGRRSSPASPLLLFVTLLLASACSHTPTPEASAVVPVAEDELASVRSTVDGPTAAKAETATDVVLLNDPSMDLRQWVSLVPTLARAHRVICWNPRAGEGVTALVELLDSVGCRRAHLVSSGEGADLALGLALEQPARVRSLVLLAPDLRGIAASPAMSAHERELLAAPAGQFGRMLASDPKFLPVGDWDEPLLNEVARLVDDHAVAYREVLRARTARPEGKGVSLESVKHFAKVAAPLLIVVSAADDAHVGDVAEALSRTIGGSVIEWLAEGGHLPQLELPAPMLVRLDEWMKERDADK